MLRTIARQPDMEIPGILIRNLPIFLLKNKGEDLYFTAVDDFPHAKHLLNTYNFRLNYFVVPGFGFLSMVYGLRP